jgi:hypothetical protein
MKTLATGLLVLLSVFVGESSIAQQRINARPDAIFYNGKIITVDSRFTIAQAFAVRGDIYVAVGTDAAIQALAGQNTRLVDLRGRRPPRFESHGLDVASGLTLKPAA